MDLLSLAGALWAPRLDPYNGYNFWVEIDGLIAGQFREVRGLEGTVQVHEYAEGGRNEYTHRIPGAVKYSNLTLSHGVTDLVTLWGWYDEVANGITYRQNMTVMLLDNMRLPVMWWDIADALPVRWTGPTFDATRSEVAVQSLEFIHNGISKSVFSDVVSGLRLSAAIANAMIK